MIFHMLCMKWEHKTETIDIASDNWKPIEQQEWVRKQSRAHQRFRSGISQKMQKKKQNQQKTPPKKYIYDTHHLAH